MRRLCARPDCSDEGTVSYGMIAEELVFWLASRVGDDDRALCRRHADAMTVPRGWTLDDRREDAPRLFAAARYASEADRHDAAPPRRVRRRDDAAAEQLVIDGTGEIVRPDVPPHEPVDAPAADRRWVASFDPGDDLDGVLAARSPLLARAFRGDRRR